MCRFINSIIGVTAVAGITGFVGSRSSGFSSTASVEGVWRVAEVTVTAPAPQTITPTQASLVFITRKHYSRVEIHASGARPTIPDASKATADELRQVWGPVVAEAGGYELSGSTLTLRPVVAKNPASMAPGTFFAYSYRIAGDTLWVTHKSDHRGAVSNPSTIKLTRVE
jgi:hypothetical protein